MINIQKSALWLVALTTLSVQAQTAVQLQVDWATSLGTNKTVPSLQVVVSPELRVGNPLHDPTWKALKDLGTENVRFAPWLQYPKLSVAELEPPVNGKRSWNTDLIDPITLDYFNATAGHSRLMSFSVTPQWLWSTPSRVNYPADPNVMTRSYQQGSQLHTGGVQELAKYYTRLVSWYTLGGFTDDDGSFKASGFHFKIDTWEILNEVEVAKEHAISPSHYVLIYDAIANAIREVQPNMQFMGPALGNSTLIPSYDRYFLNPASHAPGTPINWVSYHFYAHTDSGNVFSQANAFLSQAAKNEAYKKLINPNVKTAIDEIGVLGSSSTRIVNPLFWNLSAANYAYIYGHLTLLGIDLACMSELSVNQGYPTVGMIDANTGLPNARYWVLKLIKDNIKIGDSIAKTTSSYSGLYAQAFQSANGQRKILVVNQSKYPMTFSVAGVSLLSAQAVLSVTPNTAPVSMAGPQIQLDAYAVAVVKVP